MDRESLEEGKELQLQFEKRGGLLPVVVQELHSGEVLMLAYTNLQAWQATLDSGLAHFYSTSRQEIWKKGATSGNMLYLRQIKVDCDQDALLYIVELEGEGVCHTKNQEGLARKSCFYRYLQEDNSLKKNEP